jgi:hypothetical protein
MKVDLVWTEEDREKRYKRTAKPKKEKKKQRVDAKESPYCASNFPSGESCQDKIREWETACEDNNECRFNTSCTPANSTDASAEKFRPGGRPTPASATIYSVSNDFVNSALVEEISARSSSLHQYQHQINSGQTFTTFRAPTTFPDNHQFVVRSSDQNSALFCRPEQLLQGQPPFFSVLPAQQCLMTPQFDSNSFRLPIVTDQDRKEAFSATWSTSAGKCT